MDNHHMLVVQIFHVESPTTLVTEMLVIPRVVSHVTSQVRLVRKCRSTNAAWKSIWLLIGRAQTNHHLRILQN